MQKFRLIERDEEYNKYLTRKQHKELEYKITNETNWLAVVSYRVGQTQGLPFHEMAIKYVNDYFGTSGFAGLEVRTVPPGAENIKIGSTRIQDTLFSGEFTSGEVLSVSWVEEPGYLFSHWLVNHLATQDISLITQGDWWKYLVSREIPDFNLNRYLLYGGLPAVYLSDYPEEELNAYVNTYLKEEILAEGLIRRLPPFSRFLKTIALANAEMINFTLWS